MNNYFIIHGTYGSNKGNWFPWLKEQLENKGLECIVPQFLIGNEQNYDNWKIVLDSYSNKIDEDTIFIGHSLAPIFIIKYLLEKKIKIKALILVSGFNNYYVNEEYDKCNKSFYINESNISDIHNYCNSIYCLYSNNDPYIKLSELERFANALDAKKYLIKDGGHLNSEFGYIKFDEILSIIEEVK
jgi:predicted alpha/beta hydrolase family esterase